MRYGCVIDQRKCIGCQACTVGRKEENEVPLGGNRSWAKYTEQGTQPKLFYLGADEASLTPAMQERGGRYAFAEGSRIPTPGQSNVADFAPAATSGHESVDLLRMARTVYDVAHPERPWGWKVS